MSELQFEQSLPQNKSVRYAHGVVICILALVSISLFMPLITHPHWGTFDDANLTVQLNRRLTQYPLTEAYIWYGGMRAGIYYWMSILWRLFPENPAGFYSVNCALFIGTLALTYFNSFQISHSTKYSAFAVSLLFFAPGLFEVLYTLDKQEAYLPLLFSAVIAAHIVARKTNDHVLAQMTPALLLTAFCATCAYISKETSSIIIIFSGLLIAFTFLGSWKGKGPVSAPGAATAPESSALTNADSFASIRRVLMMFVFTLAPMLILRLAIFPTSNSNYVSVTFDVQKIFEKFVRYSQAMPTYFLVLAFVFGLAAWTVWYFRKYRFSSEWQIFISLASSAIAATTALLSFNTFEGILLYIWLPIYTLLLPCLAYGLSFISRFGGSRGKIASATILTLLALGSLLALPQQILRAQYQFALDSLTAKLSENVASIVAKSEDEVIAALPTFGPDAYEIPENIECYVRSNLEKSYFDRSDEKVGAHKFSVLDFLSTSWIDVPAPSQPGEFRLTQFRGKQLTYKTFCPRNYIGWSGYQLLAGATPDLHWVKRPFNMNALLLVPYGDLPYDDIMYRGASFFASQPENAVSSFPQLKFEELGSVERRIYRLGGGRSKLGWKILRVVSAQPISLPATCMDGWITNGQRIFCKFDSSSPILQIVSSVQLQPTWYVISTDGEKRDLNSKWDGLKSTADIQLAGKNQQIMWASLYSKAADANARWHVDHLELVGHAK